MISVCLWEGWVGGVVQCNVGRWFLNQGGAAVHRCELAVDEHTEHP